MEVLNYEGILKVSPIHIYVYPLEEWKRTIYYSKEGRTVSSTYAQ